MTTGLLLLEQAYWVADCDPISAEAALVDLIGAIEDVLRRASKEPCVVPRTEILFEIDKVYREADMSQLTTTAIIALLRTPYRARSGLFSWQCFLERAIHTLESRGLDSTRLLRGLIDIRK